MTTARRADTAAHPFRRARAKTVTQRQRQPTEIRRRLIIEAARNLIADKALFHVQVRDIADACGVSPGTVTYHFASLDEILFEVVRIETEMFYQPLVERAAQQASPCDKLTTLLSGMFQPDDDTRRHWLVWIDFWSAAARRETYGEWMRTHYARWHRMLQQTIKEGRAAGQMTCSDDEQAALHIAMAVDGLAVQCFNIDPLITVDRARRLALAFAASSTGAAPPAP